MENFKTHSKKARAKKNKSAEGIRQTPEMQRPNASMADGQGMASMYGPGSGGDQVNEDADMGKKKEKKKKDPIPFPGASTSVKGNPDNVTSTMMTGDQVNEGKLIQPLLNVVNDKDEVIGKVRSNAWKQASTLLGASAQLTKHKTHGWSWISTRRRP